jgi:hypothetical protein
MSAASTAFATKSIVNSKHNLGSTTEGITLTGVTKSGNTQICIYCHAPHGASRSELLWNRNNPAAGNFRLYNIINGANNNSAYTASFTADSTSLFCMSCHDGTVSMDGVKHAGTAALLGDTGGDLTNGKIGNTSTNLGTNLTTTHPINFPVSANGQNDLYVITPMATAKSMGGGAGTATTTFPLFAANGGATSNGLECGSCQFHAV